MSLLAVTTFVLLGSAHVTDVGFSAFDLSYPGYLEVARGKLLGILLCCGILFCRSRRLALLVAAADHAMLWLVFKFNINMQQ